jgi:plastocyanin
MKKALPVLVLVLAAIALAACGSDNGTTTEAETEAPSGAAAGETEAGGEEGGAEEAEEEGGGASSSVEIEADPSGGLSYTEEEVTAKAGNLTIDFKNPSPVGHDVKVEAEGGEELGGTEVITESSATASVKGLKPGKYTFFCSVPGHREAGMEGTLTVE